MPGKKDLHATILFALWHTLRCEETRAWSARMTSGVKGGLVMVNGRVLECDSPPVDTFHAHVHISSTGLFERGRQYELLACDRLISESARM